MNSTEGIADLHMHTVASDGTCSVAERSQQARECGLDAIAITDHDSVSAEISNRQTVNNGIKLIAGVEVRADVQGTKIELLGYYIDPDDERLDSMLTEIRDYRRDRNQRILSRLRETTSFDRPYEDIRGEADGILGRPHIARILVEEGIVNSIDSAFDEYLANNKTAFIPMKRVPAHEVIDAIKHAGGVVSLAHPGRVRTESIGDIIDELVEVGLDGIEVQYPYDEAPTEGYAGVSVEDAAALAEKHGLLQTGGSDCHGPDSGKFRIGEVRVSGEQIKSLRNCADQRRPL
jgi:predicted metal-dependent phosphoesterase TrpH